MPAHVKKSAATKVSAKKSSLKKAAGTKPAAKATAGKSDLRIKYSDKSAGQPELVPIFEAIKEMMLPYEKGSLKFLGGSGGQVGLVSDKPVAINGKLRHEYWFAGALVQKGYVGFYFMPATEPSAQKSIFQPELLKCLKGKSCFHIKKHDAVIMQQIKESLAKGYRHVKEKGWL